MHARRSLGGAASALLAVMLVLGGASLDLSAANAEPPVSDGAGVSDTAAPGPAGIGDEKPAGQATETPQEAKAESEDAAGAASAAAEDRAGASSVTATTISLAVSASSVVFGSPVTLTATVSPAAAEGGVQFFAGSERLGDPAAASSGVAALQTSVLPVGDNRISAVFTPTDPAKYSASTSREITVTVQGQSPQPSDVDVSGATLEWGVKQSFRNYVTGGIAKGSISTTGTTTGAFQWPSGIGAAKTDGSTADVSFGRGNGVRFTGHEMQGKYALALQFTNPRVEVTSATKGKLYLDVKSRKFAGLGSVSNSFFEQNGVYFADLALASPTGDGKTLTWQGVGVTLTAAGGEAFGGFYPTGTELDPLSLTLPLAGEAISKTPTSTGLVASPAKATQGTPVTLTASVAPLVAGVVTFSAGGKQLGDPVPVAQGRAVLSTRSLPVGVWSVRASFAPEDQLRYGHSLSQATQVTVVSGSPPPAPAPAGGGSPAAQAAGSLSWGISAQFVAYTTCEGKENYGMTHCAKGTISTSGVGAGYLFPQTEGSSWNAATQTGTVNYTGSVSFTGYGTTMFNVTNPAITVTGPSSATLSTGNTTRYGPESYQLDLSSASKTVGSNGEVTWRGVPVRGSLSGNSEGGGGGRDIGLDNLTFTVGAASAVSYGSTQKGADAKPKRTPAKAPPATTGITVLTPIDKLKPGGRIEIEASGFEADDEGVLVVIYSDPVVLDEKATADRGGVVRWSGTLPQDLTGKHTITLQGSTNAGAVIDIVEEKDQQSAKAQSRKLRGDVASGEAAAAGILAPAGGMALWEWWVSAGGLAAIAACTTVLAIRQRRNVS